MTKLLSVVPRIHLSVPEYFDGVIDLALLIV